MEYLSSIKRNEKGLCAWAHTWNHCQGPDENIDVSGCRLIGHVAS